MEEVFEACAIGDKLAFKRLYEKNTSLLAQRLGRSRNTPSHLICRFKQKELASLILGLQPDMPKAKNDKEETPLHEASRVGELENCEGVVGCMSICGLHAQPGQGELSLHCMLLWAHGSGFGALQ
ncbi:hypothetical protein MRB53_013182 [Persea americana]|uniref:Uncharacterized protein n=1 Tax=Persea americana TaxID=3435 RepID=A0ACC2K793_PERAE|nr:hypothetical protein MRB53_013182 [Persea americana]